MNQNIIKLVVLVFFTSFIFGCATSSNKSTQENQEVIGKQNVLIQAEQQLLGYFTQWEGTPYRLGGNGRQGIDCSAYVRNAYQAVFEIDTPRTTLGLSSFGNKVKKSELIPGDLVLFKTSKTSRHVGVVLNGNKFMHVSEKKGVIISTLNNVYWRKKYWKAVRPNNGLNLSL